MRVSSLVDIYICRQARDDYTLKAVQSASPQKHKGTAKLAHPPVHFPLSRSL